MRFTAASVALFAGHAAAVPQGEAETLYSTEDVTITSCGPTVTDCPSRQTSTPQGVEAVTSSTPSAVPTSSATPSSSPVAPVEVPSNTPSSSSPMAPVQPSSSSAPVMPVQVPTSSASVIPVTTCVPTVTYSTVQVPATAPARPSGASPRGGSSSMPVIPVAVPSGSSSARYVPPLSYISQMNHANSYSGSASASASTSAPSSLFTGAASTVGNSFSFAGAAAAAAFFLA